MFIPSFIGSGEKWMTSAKPGKLIATEELIHLHSRWVSWYSRGDTPKVTQLVVEKSWLEGNLRYKQPSFTGPRFIMNTLCRWKALKDVHPLQGREGTWARGLHEMTCHLEELSTQREHRCGHFLFNSLLLFFFFFFCSFTCFVRFTLVAKARC